CTGAETTRLSACRYCVISNNTFENAATNWAALLKFHSGNTYGSSSTWIGQYAEYIEISDNLFAGPSGGQMVEITPQNQNDDERVRLVIFERNLLVGQTGNSGGPGRMIFSSAVNATMRNNVFSVAANDTTPPWTAMQIARRGIEPVPSAVEVYNNTCYYRTTVGSCVAFDSSHGCCTAAAQNSWAYNNLLFNNGASSATVVDNGVGNRVGNNTTNSAANPLLMNASGSFRLISDF